MKKLISAFALACIMLTGATQAQAALLTDWTYTLADIKLSNYNTNFVGVGTDGSASFISGNYDITLSPQKGDNPDGSYDGDLTFAGDDTSASTPEDDKLLNQTTADAPLQNTSATKLADLSFSYNVISDTNPNVKMNVTYTIPLYTFYDATLGTAYVYYNNSEVGTSGATAITEDGYAYGVTGIGLFVDGRALVSFPGGENDPNLYSGWAINTDTMNNNYDKYVVGGDSNVSIGEKEFKGKFEISGIFSITNTLIPTPPAPTPEPATMLLTGLGLAGLGAMKRRRNKVSVK